MLRAPTMSDYVQWSEMREISRPFLTPWEPIWPSDDLTRSGFRRRLRRYAEMRQKIAPTHFWSFARMTAC